MRQIAITVLFSFAGALAAETALSNSALAASQPTLQASPAPTPTVSTEPTPVGEMGPSVAPTATMHKTISVLGGIGYSYGFSAAFGVGARFQWTLVPEGFLSKQQKTIHDELALEPGFDYFHAGYSVGAGAYNVSWDYNEFTPLVGVVWNVWLNDKFAVYPKVDVGYRIASWSESVNGTTTATAHADLFPLYFQGAAGVVYRTGVVSLRAELGWEALRAGVALSL